MRQMEHLPRHCPHSRCIPILGCALKVQNSDGFVKLSYFEDSIEKPRTEHNYSTVVTVVLKSMSLPNVEWSTQPRMPLGMGKVVGSSVSGCFQGRPVGFLLPRRCLVLCFPPK